MKKRIKIWIGKFEKLLFSTFQIWLFGRKSKEISGFFLPVWFRMEIWFMETLLIVFSANLIPNHFPANFHSLLRCCLKGGTPSFKLSLSSSFPTLKHSLT